jgi:hypothetical protein
MAHFHTTVVKALHSKKMHRSAGAIAGLASALSVMVGLLAAYATPHGLGRVEMALHMTKKPFIVRLAPIITGVSVGIAAAAGLLGFYLWLIEQRQDSPSEVGPDADT